MDHLKQLWNSSPAFRVVAVGVATTLTLALLVPSDPANSASQAPASAPTSAPPAPLEKAKAWLTPSSTQLPMPLPGKVHDTMNRELDRFDETAEIAHEGINAGGRLATKAAETLLDILPADPPVDRTAP